MDWLQIQICIIAPWNIRIEFALDAGHVLGMLVIFFFFFFLLSIGVIADRKSATVLG
jgi:hypothetical protein